MKDALKIKQVNFIVIALALNAMAIFLCILHKAFPVSVLTYIRLRGKFRDSKGQKQQVDGYYYTEYRKNYNFEKSSICKRKMSRPRTK